MICHCFLFPVDYCNFFLVCFNMNILWLLSWRNQSDVLARTSHIHKFLQLYFPVEDAIYQDFFRSVFPRYWITKSRILNLELWIITSLCIHNKQNGFISALISRVRNKQTVKFLKQWNSFHSYRYEVIGELLNDPLLKGIQL